MSFEKSGVLATTKDADDIYMRIISGALLSVLIVAPLFGFVSDKADPRVIIPFVFFVRGLISFAF